MKFSDYIWKFLQSKGIDTVFYISGGAEAHLLESLRKTNMKCIANRHEQACAMAADAYYRISGKPAAVLITNGPGSTNTLTGVLGAYQDSIPIFIISGQVPTKYLSSKLDNELRQFGVQEVNIIPIVSTITKYAITLIDIKQIEQIIKHAYDEMINGRMGPVWIDVPLDIQNTDGDFEPLIDSLLYVYDLSLDSMKTDYNFIIDKLNKAKKPLLVVGNGIHLAKAEKEFNHFFDSYSFPAVSTWTTKDLFDHDDPRYIGNFGLLGERAANFAIQSADLLLIVGSRLSIPNIGYDYNLFSPNSYKIMVDIDMNEMEKPSLKIDLKVRDDLKVFLERLYQFSQFMNWNVDKNQNWKLELMSWKEKYPVFQPEYKTNKNKINSFYFMEMLGYHLKPTDIIVTDMGTSFTCTMQSLKVKKTNRLFTSSGCSSMGFGLPGAIGAAIAAPDRRIICICGDGGIQMNIQELQTIKQYNLNNIKIFVLNNNGYLAISLMQDNLFNGNRIGSDALTGVSAPNFCKIADAYGLDPWILSDNNDIEKWLEVILQLNNTTVCEIEMTDNQLLIPRVQSKKNDDGTIVSAALHNMFPYLPDEEVKQNLEFQP